MITLLSDSVLALLPDPKSTTLEWTLPNWDITEEGLNVMYGPLNLQILRATFHTATWFEQYISHFWKAEGERLVMRFAMNPWAASYDVAHCTIIPRDNLIAASFYQAYTHAKSELGSAPPLAWTQEILTWFLSRTWAKVSTDLFQVLLAEEFVYYFDCDDTLKACVLGTEPFNNKGIATAAGFGSLFFDGLF